MMEKGPKKRSQQHPVFPGGHPSKYWLDSTLLNFSDRTRTGVFNVIWPLGLVSSRFMILEPLSLSHFWVEPVEKEKSTYHRFKVEDLELEWWRPKVGKKKSGFELQTYSSICIWAVIISPPVLYFPINLHISSTFFQSTFISPPHFFLPVNS